MEKFEVKMVAIKILSSDGGWERWEERVTWQIRADALWPCDD